MENLVEDVRSKIKNALTINEVERIKAEFLGKDSLISKKMDELKTLSVEEKKVTGKLINETKNQISEIIASKRVEIEGLEVEKKLESESIDITIPGRRLSLGSIHPISQAIDEMLQIFSHFGFEVKDGPNIEDDWHNFTALNVPEYHPARLMQDTFYLNDKEKLLRTHTSTIQIRAMTGATPPFRFISFGRVYRNDSDATHTPMFHQMEGVVIEENINFAHLKGFLQEFVELFFEQRVKVRLRPSFFPFTEPSAEVDISLDNGGSWLEVLGSGMIHPNVLENAKIDSKKFQGFAFGLGIERFAMLKYGITDLRHLYSSDIRLNKKYNFSGFDLPSIIGGLSR